MFGWLFNDERRVARAALRDKLRAIARDDLPILNAAGACAPILSDKNSEMIHAVRASRWQVYSKYAAALGRTNIVTDAEWKDLEDLGRALQFQPDELQRLNSPVERANDRWRLQNGKPPVWRQASPLVLRTAEVLHLVAPSDLLEERVVGRRYYGQSSGFSVRVARGVTFRAGSHRGRSVSDRGLVVVAQGNACITNQRVAFAGDKKSFDLDWRKVVNVQVDTRGRAMVIGSSRGANRLLRFKHRQDANLLSTVVDGAIALAVA
jgi:hypothetical protein